MSNTQPTYEEFLGAANSLVEQGILITVNNIKTHMGRVSSTLLQTYMRERERQRNAATAFFGGKLSEKLVLAIADEVQTAIQVRTQEFEEERDRECQEKLEVQSQLVESRAESQLLGEALDSEQQISTKEREERIEERSQFMKMLDMILALTLSLAQENNNRQQDTKSDAPLEQIKIFFQQFANNITCDSEGSPKNWSQNIPSELIKIEGSKNASGNRQRKKKKRRSKKSPRSR